MRPLRFMPWLFDSNEAWEQTINDPRYTYDMPFIEFLKLYQEYRNKKGR